jgi:hypothetical protein
MHAHWGQQIVNHRVKEVQRAIRGRVRRVDLKPVGYSKEQHALVHHRRMTWINPTWFVNISLWASPLMKISSVRVTTRNSVANLLLAKIK